VLSKAEIFIGKVLGSLVANALCILLVMLFSKFVFQAIIIALDASAVFVIYPIPKPKLIARKTCVNKIRMLFSKFVFQANWGDHLGIIFLILLTQVFLAISFGLGIGYINLC
jgi:ABC-2 type transport system permease protein